MYQMRATKAGVCMQMGGPKGVQGCRRPSTHMAMTLQPGGGLLMCVPARQHESERFAADKLLYLLSMNSSHSSASADDMYLKIVGKTFVGDPQPPEDHLDCHLLTE